jgi:sec-independent protein translocase protein TatB
MTSLQKDVSDSLRIDDIDKPAETQTMPAIEPPAAPTTPEAPTPQTFVEATAHEASEPLAITHEAQPQDNAPTTPDGLKDAKAS